MDKLCYSNSGLIQRTSANDRITQELQVMNHSWARLCWFGSTCDQATAKEGF